MVSEEKKFSSHSTFTVPLGATSRWFRLTTSPYKKMLFVLGFRLAKLFCKTAAASVQPTTWSYLKRAGNISSLSKKIQPTLHPWITTKVFVEFGPATGNVITLHCTDSEPAQSAIQIHACECFWPENILDNQLSYFPQ